MNPSQVLDSLLTIAAEAAAIVDEVYRAPFDVEYKGPADPVTAADRRANELIVTRLGERFPGVPVVAEESAPERFAGFRSAERIFFVDPLDGTREFVKKNGEFVVMIGLVEGNTPTLGVLYSPVSNEAWAGAVGHGSALVAADGRRTPLTVSDVTKLGDARIVSTRSHRSAALEAALAALGAHSLAALGSAGLKCAAVATGKAEAYVAPARAGKRWDLCAGEAIITAAGGRVTDAYGHAIDYRSESLANESGIVASNGGVHDEILARLAAHRES